MFAVHCVVSRTMIQHLNVTGPKMTMCSSQEVKIQALTKAGQRIFQLILVDGARVVPIVTTEAVLPVSDILPQRLEFLEVDGS